MCLEPRRRPRPFPACSPLLATQHCWREQRRGHEHFLVVGCESGRNASGFDDGAGEIEVDPGYVEGYPLPDSSLGIADRKRNLIRRAVVEYDHLIAGYGKGCR